MDAADILRRLHEHRAWVNRQLLAAVAPLSEAQLRQPFAIGQGSVWKTLTHLYAAEYVWLAALQGDENPLTPGDTHEKLPGNQEGEGAMSTLDELCSRWSELEARWSDYLAALTDEQLETDIVKISSLSGKASTTPASDILLHLCTHAQYTSAQLINMLRQLGVDPLPPTMLITLARQEAARGARN